MGYLKNLLKKGFFFFVGVPCGGNFGCVIIGGLCVVISVAGVFRCTWAIISSGGLLHGNVESTSGEALATVSNCSIVILAFPRTLLYFPNPGKSGCL